MKPSVKIARPLEQQAAARRGGGVELAPPAYGIEFLDAAAREGPDRPHVSGPIEPRLGAQHDPSEATADCMTAKAVDQLYPASMGSLSPMARRVPAGPGVSGDMPVLPSVMRVLNEPGRQLDAGTRARMARATGEDLGAIRIHDGNLAARATAAVGSAA